VCVLFGFVMATLEKRSFGNYWWYVDLLTFCSIEYCIQKENKCISNYSLWFTLSVLFLNKFITYLFRWFILCILVGQKINICICFFESIELFSSPLYVDSVPQVNKILCFEYCSNCGIIFLSIIKIEILSKLLFETHFFKNFKAIQTYL